MKASALAVLLLAVPLAAQNWEVGLFAGQQSYKSVETPLGSAAAKNKVVYIGRFGAKLLKMGPSFLQLTAGFQNGTDSPIKAGSTYTGQEFKQRTFISTGLMVNVDGPWAFGGGVEYRFEKVNITSSYVGSVNQDRPWARFNVGKTFPVSEAKYFVGLEAAMPLTSQSASTVTTKEEEIRSYAPKLQVGLYAGIRF